MVSLRDLVSFSIQELEAEILKDRERIKALSDELRKLKVNLTEKDSSIDKLQQSVARLNAVSARLTTCNTNFDGATEPYRTV